VLGVEDEDLEVVFDILDADGDGKITHKEFVQQLYKIQTYELRSAHCFMKHYVEDIRKHVKLLWRRSSDSYENRSFHSSPSCGAENEGNQPEPEEIPETPPTPPSATATSEKVSSIAPCDCDQQSTQSTELQLVDPSLDDELGSFGASHNADLAVEEPSNDGGEPSFEDLKAWVHSSTGSNESIDSTECLLSKDNLKQDAQELPQTLSVSCNGKQYKASQRNALVRNQTGMDSGVVQDAKHPNASRLHAQQTKDLCNTVFVQQDLQVVDAQTTQWNPGFALPGLLEQQTDLEYGVQETNSSRGSRQKDV